MNCHDVGERLVAYRDDELSRSESQLVGEHIARCPSCRALDEALMEVTPLPYLEPSGSTLALLHEATDPNLLWAKAREHRTPISWSTRMARWMRRDTDVPKGMLVAWAATFLVVFGWGLANQYEAAALAAQLEAPTVRSAAHEGGIPADHYLPASYSSSSDGTEEYQ